ncbi:unnamed protein product [Ectocarpus sp. 12 AP-2014]
MAPRIVVAVDFGTTRSAWAYKVGGDEPDDKTDDKIFVRLPGGVGPAPSARTKTETAALINRRGRGELVAFGQAALERHAENAATAGSDPSDDSEALFKWYKTALFQPKPGEDTAERVTAKSTSGDVVPLLGVMTATLRYFKKDAVGFLSSLTGRTIRARDVNWVLTVPAVYDDFAKHFMRQAAHEAGMIDKVGSTNLRLCLEPEAACLEVIPRGANNPLTCEAEGKKMMIVDCGGGTVDITTHNIVTIDPLNVVEVAAPTGGAWGSTQVDEAFKKWLQRFLGEWYEKIAETEILLSIMAFWERKKAAFDGHESAEPVRLNLSALGQRQMMDSHDLEDLRTRYNRGESRRNRVEGKGYMVILPTTLVTSFFTPTLDSIARCLRGIKGGSALRNLHRVFVVGGFSRSPLLMQVVRAELQNASCRVVEVSEPDIAIVRGAVKYFDESAVFNSRRARLTYGASVLHAFDEKNAEHRRRRDTGETLKYDDRDEVMVDGCFFPHIRIGENVPTNGVTSRENYTPVSLENETNCIQVYASSARDPAFVDEDSCFMLGKVSFPLDMTKKTRQERAYRVEFTFGGPELTVKILHRTEEKQIADAVMTLSRVPKSYDGISGGLWQS